MYSNTVEKAYGKLTKHVETSCFVPNVELTVGGGFSG